MTLTPKTAKLAATAPPYSDYHTSNMVLKAVGAGGIRKKIIESKASAGITHFSASTKQGEEMLMRLYDFLTFQLGVNVHVVDERHLRVNSKELAFAVKKSKDAGTFKFSPVWNGETETKGVKPEQQPLHQKPKSKTTDKSKVVEEGDIFYTSWGYDQTNVDFIAVMTVSKSGKTAKCLMMKKEPATDPTKSSFTRESRVKPAFSEMLRAQYPRGGKKLWGGDQFTMKIKREPDGTVYLRGSYPYIKGDAQHGKRLDTFFKHKEGETYYETPHGLGH